MYTPFIFLYENLVTPCGTSIPRKTLLEILVKVTEQGKHCGGKQPPGGRLGYVWGEKGHQERMIMVQKGCQQSLTNQHTNCLGEKALEPLESSAKDKKGICPKPLFSHLHNRNKPCSVWGYQMKL